MSERITIFAAADFFVTDRLGTFLDESTRSVIAEVTGPLRAALVLYVLLYGMAILRGSIAEPVMDFAIRSLKLGLVYFLATTIAYTSFVTDPLFHLLPNALASAITGESTPDAGASFDRFFARATALAEKIWNEARVSNLAPLILSALVYLAAALAAAVGFGIVLITKVALALLVALGPIFIACALFESTRRYFYGWLSQAVNYLVLFALIIAVLQIVLSLVAQQWSEIEGGDPLTGGMLFVVLCLLAAVFFLQTPAIAAGIAGGASAGLADFANAVARRSGSGGGSSLAPQEASRKPPRGGGAVRPTGAA